MGVKITAAYLRQQQKLGKIKGFAESRPAINGKPKGKKRKSQQVSAGILWMKDVLEKAGVSHTREYIFHPERKWRFDIVLLPLSMYVAIEYDGINSVKSRHTTKDGYTEDHNKFNAAIQLGWKVYRYTKGNLHQFEQDLKTIINNNT